MTEARPFSSLLWLLAWAVGWPVLLPVAAARYTKVGPNEVLIVSGRRRTVVDREGRRRTLGYRVIWGGGTVVWPIIEQARRLSLELMGLEVKTPEVYTIHGVPVAVDGVAHVKVRGDEEAIQAAAEHFLSRPQEEIMKTALQIVEGHMRAVLGTISIEELYTQRREFAERVKELASRDLAKMGLEIVSLTIRNINDPRGYLEALGRPRTAQVKRDAIIGEARADEEAKSYRYQVDTKIEEARRDYELKRAEVEAAINQRRAEADLAYDLQRFKTAQLVKREEVQLGILEKELQTELEEKEILRKERELMATVIRPAEAERQRIQALAEAERYRLEAEAQGEAEALRARGLAEAEVIREKGLSEAQTMDRKADAWARYNQAAVTEVLVNVLPKMAEAVAAPLARTERIVVISGGGDSTGASKVTRDVTEVIAQLPPIVEALTGVKLEELLRRLPGFKGADQAPAPQQPQPEDGQQ
ncbi:Inner membrane protein YqiK [bacterium HR25]|nr:Inner membrane protein YqiK [bacterium HR25]